MELNIEKFDPTVEQLNELVVVSKKVTNLSPIEEVKKARIQLKTARVAITKKGKELRDDAIKFQKAVIAKEKELVAIIEPEEERLSEIEEVVKQAKLREERIALLPTRYEQLNAIGDTVTVTDDELLEMDTDTFSAYRNQRISDKNEADRLAIEAKEREIKEKEEALAREKEMQEREKKAREEAQLEAERKLKLAKEEAELKAIRDKEEADRRVIEERQKVEREQKEKEEREAKAKEEAERLAKEEQEKLEKQKRYKKWLEENNYNEETDKIFNSEKEVTLYRFVSEFKK